MKKLLVNKFDKKDINDLPVVQFEGRIIVVLSPGETEKAVDYLLSQDILGVDTETRPSFKKGAGGNARLLFPFSLELYRTYSGAHSTVGGYACSQNRSFLAR